MPRFDRRPLAACPSHQIRRLRVIRESCGEGPTWLCSRRVATLTAGKMSSPVRCNGEGTWLGFSGPVGRRLAGFVDAGRSYTRALRGKLECPVPLHVRQRGEERLTGRVAAP
jgi:hypothetical protein